MAEALSHAILITGFVLAMMLVMEYANVRLRGSGRLRSLAGGWRQYVVAGVLGALPGCLGPWAVVAMYSHGLVTMGALVTAMVATTGDEAYVMLALMPERAAALFAGLAVCGVLVGALTDLALKRPYQEACEDLTVHTQETGDLLAGRRWTRTRVALIVCLLAFAALVAADWVGHDHWQGLRIALLAVSAVALCVVAMVPDHFLEEHIWGHVLRRHALRMFLWTLGALIVAHWIEQRIDLDALGPQGRWTMLLAACLVGIIPQSGPHLVFVTLYAEGVIPMSVLLANSIVQDGHGMLPLLAESRRAFLVAKAINLAAGLVIGGLALALNF